MQPKTRFGWEPLSAIFDAPNFSDMVVAQYNELAHFKEVPLLFDRAELLRMEELGFYRTWTARQGKLLIGWIEFFIHRPYHYAATLFAVDNGYYLDPGFRDKGWTGYRLWAEAVPALKKLGVTVVIGHTNAKAEHPADAVFKRLGFGPWGMLYGKVLK